MTAALNGGTHMPFEDMGIMRAIPTATVLDPTDSTMLKSLIKEMASSYGVHYMRLLRKNAKKIYADDTRFTIGKAMTLRDGADATIVASGYCVAEALKASQMLEAEGISLRILDTFTWKPLDREAVVRAARETGAIVTAENHNVINGLGSAVAEVVVRECPVPMEMIGVQDEFGEVGPEDYLADRFRLTAPYIVKAVKKAMARK